MGINPLTWQEIRAWRLENSLSLLPYEVNFIRQLSVEYCGAYHEGNDASMKAPFETQEIDREQQSKRFDEILTNFSKEQEIEE